MGWQHGDYLISRQWLSPQAGVGQITSSAITTSEVSSLDHEVLDHTVEFAVLEAKTFLGLGVENRE